MQEKNILTEYFLFRILLSGVLHLLCYESPNVLQDCVSTYSSEMHKTAALKILSATYKSHEFVVAHSQILLHA